MSRFNVLDFLLENDLGEQEEDPQMMQPGMPQQGQEEQPLPQQQTPPETTPEQNSQETQQGVPQQGEPIRQGLEKLRGATISDISMTPGSGNSGKIEIKTSNTNIPFVISWQGSLVTVSGGEEDGGEDVTTLAGGN